MNSHEKDWHTVSLLRYLENMRLPKDCADCFFCRFLLRVVVVICCFVNSLADKCTLCYLISHL